MKRFKSIPADLYILKTDIPALESGESARGFIEIPEDQKGNYELVTRYAFQPVAESEIISENEFDVVLIMK